MVDLLSTLAREAGIQAEYRDVQGQLHHTTPEVQRALLAAMGYDAATEGEIQDSLARLRRDEFPPVIVMRTPVRDLPFSGDWTLTLENGEFIEGRAEERIHFRRELPLGYHTLRVEDKETRLIVAPGSAYAPDWLLRGEKAWGIACHLYTVASARNWGIGDFADLKDLLHMTAGEGGRVVAVNPFHALSPQEPEQASPYWPSSRTFLNPLYVALSAPPTVATAALIDYGDVARTKYAALRKVAARLSGHPGVDDFIRQGGDALEDFCLFSALSDRLAGPWSGWPEAFRDPRSRDVRAFLRDHGSEVRVHATLQWLAERQLADAAAGTDAVLMRDLAVGVSPNGAEAWHRQDLYPKGVRFGAPPDPLGPRGQDWGLPPPDPHALRAQAYEPLTTTWRANMRRAGALRIDHVMALERLFWIPPGGTAADGAYVSYPVDDLFALLALESLRAKCLIVGEDLGTVPHGFRERMAKDNMLSTRLFYFERHPNGFFKRPETYPARSVIQAATHDLPTLAGYWRDADGEERALILGALKDQGLLDDRPDIAVDEIIAAVHAFLGLSASQLALINLGDVIGATTRLNVPGTADEYPNWRARLTETLDAIRAGRAWPAATAVMRRTRGRTTASAV